MHLKSPQHLKACKEKNAEEKEWENHHILNILSLINIHFCLYYFLVFYSVNNAE